MVGVALNDQYMEKKMDSRLQKIYNDFMDKALSAGFTFDEWWKAVLRFIVDEFNADSASWAIAAELAYDDLIFERSI
jgi:hypothetical protein